MADVTDCVYRRVIAERGKPDVFFTEFTSADGLAHERGREKLLVNLKYSELERPIVAQIFGSRPENIKKSATLCRELGFDGIDINMGCPDRAVEKQGAGAAMIKTPRLAREVIDAAREGSGGLPVSVKTRLGYNEVDWDWLKMLANSGIAALTVHLRTRKEMSKVGAHWELASKLQELSLSAQGAKLIANGDVEDMSDAREKAEKYDPDGVMLGRAIFGNPWLFANLASSRSSQIEHPAEALAKGGRPAWSTIFSTIIYHSKLFEKEFPPRSLPAQAGLGGVGKSFAVMRKFFGAYVKGHPQASDLREQLMKCENSNEVESVLKRF